MDSARQRSSSASRRRLSINTSALPSPTVLSASASAPIHSSSASRTSARPPSSASIRPSSSAPLRPSPSVSSRPSSSALSSRPLSSASTRPKSRLTQRPGSRISHRPISKQSSRLLPSYHRLVAQLTGLTPENDPENFATAVDFVFKNLDQTSRPAANVDLTAVEKRIHGHTQKALITSNDELAVALDTAYGRVKSETEREDDLDSDIKTSRLPNHLQFLLLLSQSPSRETFRIAEDYLEGIRNPPKPPAELTWKDILAEEPFEGQHWEGVHGLPPGSTVEDWDTHSGGSTPSLSPLDDSDDLDDLDNLNESLTSSDDSDASEVQPVPSLVKGVDHSPRPHVTYGHRQDLEALQARQYWRPEWRIPVSTTRPFDIGDASTLGPSMQRVLGKRTTLMIGGPEREKFIPEHDAVREVLMALQGRKNIMMTWVYNGPDAFSFVPDLSIRLMHLTAAAQASILASFARSATTLEHLRKFVSAIYLKASSDSPPDPVSARSQHLINLYRRNTLTLEACVAAVDTQLGDFESWCASQEEEMCKAEAGIGPPLVVSLLALDKAYKDRFAATFSVSLDVLRAVIQQALRMSEPLKEIWTFSEGPMRISPSSFASSLLDSLWLAIQDHVSMGDTVTSRALTRIFGGTMEPMWKMTGQWMKDGMPVGDIVNISEQSHALHLEDEFFVDDMELPILDPDFWTDGFVLRKAGGGLQYASVPTILSHVAQDIIDAGKAIGLLRALSSNATFEHEAEKPWMSGWQSFLKFLQYDTPPGTDETKPAISSTEQLIDRVNDEVRPYARGAQEMLQKVLIDDCDLWIHLSAIEDLFLMRKGDAVSRFVDVLFTRMDSKYSWSDFHFLNTAFRDVVEASPRKWIDASLVRLSHRGSRDKPIARTVRAIESLLMEYAVPFPLTYIFGPRVMQVYSSIFAFLLQIRRAKNVLERILVRGTFPNMSQPGSEMKVFYAMRSKLSWFVNALLNFLSTNVLHVQVLSFHQAFRRAGSLNDMIRLHDDHLSKLEGRCLLQRNTSALQRAIISILDMTLHFSDYFVAFAGDTTHDISRQSILMMKRHRSRRARRQRKNVVGFSQSLQEADDSSDAESDFDDDLTEGNAPEPSFSLAMSTMSTSDEGSLDRLAKMSSELDTLVRFVRRGVESLAAGSGEAAPTFGILAFALEDWDR